MQTTLLSLLVLGGAVAPARAGGLLAPGPFVGIVAQSTAGKSRPAASMHAAGLLAERRTAGERDQRSNSNPATFGRQTADTGVTPPTRLRCDHVPTPALGVEVSAGQRLRLSWNHSPPPAPAAIGAVQAPQGHVQDSYSVRIMALNSSSPTVWAGTATPGSRAAFVLLPPGVLQPQRSYSWQVRRVAAPSSDGQSEIDGGSPWSTPAGLHTAPAPVAWAAASWLNGSLGMLRTTVDVPAAAEIAEAFVYAATMGYHALKVNGHLVGNGTRYLFEPGQTTAAFRTLYGTYNITSLLQPGRNVVGAVLGNGGYNADVAPPMPKGRFAGTSHGRSTACADVFSWGNAPCCATGNVNGKAHRALISVRLADGKHLQYSTDAATWTTAPSPVVADNLYVGEAYDADKELPAFWLPGSSADEDRLLAAAGVEPAQVATPAPGWENISAGVLMSPRLFPDVQLVGTYPAQRVTEPAPGVYVFHFPEQVVGRCTLRIPPHAQELKTGPLDLKLQHSALLNGSDGQVLTQYGYNGGSAVRWQSTDGLHVGAGRSVPAEWTPLFTWRNFKYVQVTGLPPGFKPTPDMLVALNSRTAVDTDHGSWTSDSSSMNGVLQLMNEGGMLGIFQSIPMDVADRERKGWLGDSQLIARAASYGNDMTTFYLNHLRNMRDTQMHHVCANEDAPDWQCRYLTVMSPTSSFLGGDGDPAWTGAIHIIAEQVYSDTGDLAVVEQAFPGIVDWLERWIDIAKTGLLNTLLPLKPGGDVFGDWLSVDVFSHVDPAIAARAEGTYGIPVVATTLMSNIVYLNALQTAARFAGLLGKHDVAERYRNISAGVVPAFRQAFTRSALSPPTQPLPSGNWTSWRLAAEPALFLRQTSYIGYATPCPDRGCWYDSSFSVVPALSNKHVMHNTSNSMISFQSAPETPLTPCETDSTSACPWYLTVQSSGAVMLAKDDGTAAFATSASFERQPGLANASAVSYASTLPAKLGWLLAGRGAANATGLPVISRLLVVVPPDSATGAAAGDVTWEQQRDCNLLANLAKTPDYAHSMTGDLRSLARANDTQSLFSMLIISNALESDVEAQAELVLLNDLLSTESVCEAVAALGGVDAPRCFVKRGHLTGGMTGMKATYDALERRGRVEELAEVMLMEKWPSLGYFLKSGASSLWSDWSMTAPLNTTLCPSESFAPPGAGVKWPDWYTCARSLWAGWLGQASSYYYSVFAGIQARSPGYADLELKPMIPLSVGGMNSVAAELEVPGGRVGVSWRRDPKQLLLNVSVPAGRASAMVVVPTLNLSAPVIMESGAVIFKAGKPTPAALVHGLLAEHGAAAVVSGSSAAVQFSLSAAKRASGGSFSFAIRGELPTVVTATATQAGANATLRCPPGARVVHVAAASYGGSGGCAAAGAVAVVERLCMLRPSCVVPAVDALFDPAGFKCDGDGGGGAARALLAKVDCAVA